MKIVLLILIGIIAASCSMDPEVINTTNNYYYKNYSSIPILAEPWIKKNIGDTIGN